MANAWAAFKLRRMLIRTKQLEPMVVLKLDIFQG
jgi:hypothetical protein